MRIISVGKNFFILVDFHSISKRFSGIHGLQGIIQPASEEKEIRCQSLFQTRTADRLQSDWRWLNFWVRGKMP
jgi:hypothetical protein